MKFLSLFLATASLATAGSPIPGTANFEHCKHPKDPQITFPNIDINPSKLIRGQNFTLTHTATSAHPIQTYTTYLIVFKKGVHKHTFDERYFSHSEKVEAGELEFEHSETVPEKMGKGEWKVVVKMRGERPWGESKRTVLGCFKGRVRVGDGGE